MSYVYIYIYIYEYKIGGNLAVNKWGQFKASGDDSGLLIGFRLLCKIKTCPLELLSIVLVCSHKMLLYCNQFKSKLSRVFFAFSTKRKVFHILFSH